MEWVSVFFLGMLVSGLGQLPLGNMNITATQISVHERFSNAWKFGLGVALIEMVWLRVSLIGMDWVVHHLWLFRLFTWLTVIMFLVLGVITLRQAMGKKEDQGAKNVLLKNDVPRFVLGMTMSAMNPAQLPYWVLWGTTVIRSGQLKPGFANYNFFTIGAGCGTIAGIALYIYGGNWIIAKLRSGHRILNLVMGIIFIIAALFQLYRVVLDPTWKGA